MGEEMADVWAMVQRKSVLMPMLFVGVKREEEREGGRQGERRRQMMGGRQGERRRQMIG